MCVGGSPGPVVTPAPRTRGEPIPLAPVDEIEVTTLVDNSVDGLAVSDDRVRRASLTTAALPSDWFEEGHTAIGLRAEHGFSALVRVRRGDRRATVLFDTGISPDAVVDNADRLGVELGDIGAIVLSHGHFDHTGGLWGLCQRMGRRRLPITVHPALWTRRRLAVDGSEPVELPTLSRRALEGEGFTVVEHEDPSLLYDGSVLVTGEVPRVTSFERGMPPAHQAFDGHRWVHDPAVRDDQALVIQLGQRGLVVLTGCGHAGIGNIVQHAVDLTGVDRVVAVIGGLHLAGPAFEPAVAPTVDLLTRLAPDLVVPAHCSGWRVGQELARVLPAAWVPSLVGSTYRLAA